MGLQRPDQAAATGPAGCLEQSTRYIPCDKPLPEDAGGGYRYHRDADLGPEFGAATDELLLRLMASPLPEAREYGGMILREPRQPMPSFVSRVERPGSRPCTRGWLRR